VPSNGELLNRNGVALLIGQSIQRKLAWGLGNSTCQKFLDSFGRGVGRVVWQVEEHLLAGSHLFLGLCLKVVQTCTPQVGLGIVHCFLEKRSELDQLVALVKEVMKEKL
jgi:hypothetical protein